MDVRAGAEYCIVVACSNVEDFRGASVYFVLDFSTPTPLFHCYFSVMGAWMTVCGGSWLRHASVSLSRSPQTS